MRLLQYSLFLILLLLVWATIASAQTATGEINGTVTDPNGAAVPGAAIKLINQATKTESETTTNQSGYFTFVNLKPAQYVLTVEIKGFKKSLTNAFSLGVSETVTKDVALAVGEMSEVVEVAAGSELVQSSSSELGTVINERTVEDLPLNGRNFTQLLTLTPGVTPVSTSQNSSIGGVEGNVGIPGSGFVDPSFHGQQNRSKLYFFDGIINTNVRGPTYIVIPNIDAVQEFKVVGQDAKAEFGGAMGGVMNMVSKSGGNGFHGSGFEYVRNDAFDARNSFDVCTTARCGTSTGVPKKPLPFRQNQFGAVVSGPIIKNRTFFSFSYDGWRYSQPGLALSYVPTPAEINGDFTNTPFRQQIFNPYSTRQVGTSFVRDPFRCDAAGNPLPVNGQKQQDQTTGSPCLKIPQALIFAPMQSFFKTYSPGPNFSGDAQNNFAQSRPTINNSNGWQFRIDHRFHDSDNIFFRFTQQNVTVFNPLGEQGSTGGSGRGRNYGGGWTHTFNSNLILDVRAGYAGRPGVDSSQQNQHEAGTGPLAQAGFVDVDKYKGLLVALANWTAGGNNNFGIRGPALRENPNWSVTPNLTWIRGRHNLKVGGWYIEAKRIQLNTFQTYTFANGQTGNPTSSSTGLSLASALLGFPNSFTAQLPVLHGGAVQFKYASWAGYGQDEWKVSRNVVLTLGLRYDYLTQPKTLDGRLWNNFDVQNKRWIIGAATMPPLCSVAKAAPCIPDAFQNDPHFNNVVLAGKPFFAPAPVKDNFGPRVGIAWSLNEKNVIRAGYGLYFDPLPARSQYAQNDLEAAVWPDATAFASPTGTNAPVSFTNGTAFNIIQFQQQGFATPLPVNSPWGVGSFDDEPNYKDPYSHQWHVEYQRELSTTNMISVAYVGSISRRLPYSGLANSASKTLINPCASTDAACRATFAAQVDQFRLMPWVGAGVNYTLSIGRANYKALETKFQRRFTNGWSTLVAYTWGRSRDTGSGYFNVENGPGGAATIQNYWDQNTAWGVSSYDITHFLSWATLYELPFGKGKKYLKSGPASWILGNWQTNFIAQARSGAPYNIIVTGDLANLGGSASLQGLSTPNNYLRPNLIADPFVAGPVTANPDPLCQKTISQGGRAADQVHTIVSWFNPCAFGVPNNTGQFGNLARNAFRGPAVYNVDFSMFKSIPITERFKLQLRMEAFNVFNIQNWNTPVNANLTLNSSGSTINASVGKISNLAQGTTPRQIQFGIRLTF
jgi:Carboxypeptidase regulatory-like domain/TonB dependent receptor-like, beta-barrel